MKDLSVAKLTALRACREGIDFVKAFGLTDYNLDDLDITGDWQDFVKWVTENKDNDIPVPVTYKSCVTFNGEVVDPNDLEALKASNGYWCIKEYNAQGLEVKFTNNYGYWQVKEYNDQGLEVKCTNSKDYWHACEYNAQGLLIKLTRSNGYWQEWEYDDQGLLVTLTRSHGYWQEWEYSDKGIIVKYANVEGFNYDTRNLPEGILCQVFKGTKVVLSVKLK